MSELIEDYASMMEWFEENRECFIKPYIEQNFKPVSWEYEFNMMIDNLYFAKVIIEDYTRSNEEKLMELIDKIKYGKSKIITIVGARGSGKTAIALYLAEMAMIEGGHKKIFYVGEPENKEMYPAWFIFIKTIDEIPNGSFAIVDEAAIKYNARMFRSKGNVELTEKMVVLRHKDVSLLLITQHLQLIDVNIRRLSDIIIYKMGVSYGIMKTKGESLSKDDKQKMLIMNRMKPRNKEDALLEYLTGSFPIFRKIINPLPRFWDEEKISKSFANYEKKKIAPIIIERERGEVNRYRPKLVQMP